MEANNIKVMREALNEIRDRLSYLFGRTDGTFNPPALKEVYEIADTAISSTPRNCDVGTAEEQAKRMEKYCSINGERIGSSWRCDNCRLCSINICELAWAQMPYEEGGDK